jgi:putative oxidoreductase
MVFYKLDRRNLDHLLTYGRLTLGVVFTYAAFLKVSMSWLTFAASIDAYQLLPDWAVTPLAQLLPWFELTLGLLLVSGFAVRWTGTAVTLLLGGFFSAMVHAHMKGLDIDCGCFGPGEKIGSNTFWRDGTLVVLALCVTAGAFLRGTSARHRLQ